MKKCYAVKIGHKTGIFFSWPECKEAVDGFPGAKYKGFSSEDDAKAWLADTIPALSIRNGHAIAYTDGSYNPNSRMCGWATLIIHDDVEHLMSGTVFLAGVEIEKMRQIPGEIAAAIEAITYCEAHNIENLTIYHDYIGLSSWANGTWQAKNPVSKDWIQKIKSTNVKVDFIKVIAHTNNHYNQIVDERAKLATENVPA